ncbi:chitin deacetylase [Chytriomyces hyalinus]|nr:chitin deacetylase [Chytriomyces hyalinus]
MMSSLSCPDNRYPSCTVVPLDVPDAYAQNRVPAPPGVPKWTAFVKSLTDESTYPWSSLVPSVNDDGGATGGGPNAKGDAWGSLKNEATEVFACPANQWALTYDDGPVYTDRTLSILKENNVVGTFFLIGADVVNNETHAKFVQDIYNAGHQIALHSWSHRQISLQSTDQVISELILNILSIYNVIGKVPRYYRPAYSAIDDRVRFILKAMGLRPVIWNIESNDAGIGQKAPSGIEITGTLTVQNVIEHVKTDFAQKYDARWNYFPGQNSSAANGKNTYDGFISLEHDITEEDIAVAREVASFVAKTGYKTVYVNACDQIMPNAGFYLDDGSALVQFIKGIKLPLTAADLEPYTGTFPLIPAGGASVNGAVVTAPSAGPTGTGATTGGAATVATAPAKSGALSSFASSVLLCAFLLAWQ